MCTSILHKKWGVFAPLACQVKWVREKWLDPAGGCLTEYPFGTTHELMRGLEAEAGLKIDRS
jgi:hypothetical protein